MIFDMDGTLFQTETLLLPAYHQLFDTLRAEGHFEGETPPEERMLGSLGMLLEDIWKVVMPEASEAAHRRADELLLQLEIEGLDGGSSRLYPGVKETLEALKAQGVRLFVASNGLEDYVKGWRSPTRLCPCLKGYTVRDSIKHLPKSISFRFCCRNTGFRMHGWWGIVPRTSKRVK